MAKLMIPGVSDVEETEAEPRAEARPQPTTSTAEPDRGPELPPDGLDPVLAAAVESQPEIPTPEPGETEPAPEAGEPNVTDMPAEPTPLPPRRGALAAAVAAGAIAVLGIALSVATKGGSHGAGHQAPGPTPGIPAGTGNPYGFDF